MNSNSLHKILLNRYEKSSLAQVYLIKMYEGAAHHQWAMDLIKSITPIEDHPDVLWLDLDEKESEYRVNSKAIESLLKFINYKQISLKTRFIFLNNAHLLNTTVSNKLLKVLEEMPSYFCLFLLAPKSQALLPTIESRAIKLNLELQNGENLEGNKQEEEIQTIYDLVSALKKADSPDALERKVIISKLETHIKNADYSDLDNLLKDLKNHFESERFNNQFLSRISPFFK